MCGPHQAERCPGHRVGKGQIHLLNIHLVGIDLEGEMALGEGGSSGRPFPTPLQR